MSSSSRRPACGQDLALGLLADEVHHVGHRYGDHPAAQESITGADTQVMALKAWRRRPRPRGEADHRLGAHLGHGLFRSLTSSVPGSGCPRGGRRGSTTKSWSVWPREFVEAAQVAAAPPRRRRRRGPSPCSKSITRRRNLVGHRHAQLLAALRCRATGRSSSMTRRRSGARPASSVGIQRTAAAELRGPRLDERPGTAVGDSAGSRRHACLDQVPDMRRLSAAPRGWWRCRSSLARLARAVCARGSPPARGAACPGAMDETSTTFWRARDPHLLEVLLDVVGVEFFGLGHRAQGKRRRASREFYGLPRTRPRSCDRRRKIGGGPFLAPRASRSRHLQIRHPPLRTAPCGSSGAEGLSVAPRVGQHHRQRGLGGPRLAAGRP